MRNTTAANAPIVVDESTLFGWGLLTAPDHLGPAELQAADAVLQSLVAELAALPDQMDAAYNADDTTALLAMSARFTELPLRVRQAKTMALRLRSAHLTAQREHLTELAAALGAARAGRVAEIARLQAELAALQGPMAEVAGRSETIARALADGRRELEVLAAPRRRPVA